MPKQGNCYAASQGRFFNRGLTRRCAPEHYLGNKQPSTANKIEVSIEMQHKSSHHFLGRLDFTLAVRCAG